MNTSSMLGDVKLGKNPSCSSGKGKKKVVEPSMEPLDVSNISYPNDNVKYIGMSDHKHFPPPITCLKKFKRGRPCAYLECNNDVTQEVKIPYTNLLVANRHEGRLKLYFIDSEEDDEMVNGFEVNEECHEPEN